jgi:hypothetical protein
VRRDLVSACFLERKYGDSLYFAHRSFQEFLVAEYLIGTLGKSMVNDGRSGDVIPRMAAAATPEVAAFIADVATRGDCRRFDHQLATYRGRLGRELLLAWVNNRDYAAWLRTQLRERKQSAWHTQIVTLATLAGRDGFAAEDVVSNLAEGLSETSSSSDRLVQIVCILALASSLERQQRGQGGVWVWRLCQDLYRFISKPKTSASLATERDFLFQSLVRPVLPGRRGSYSWHVGRALRSVAQQLRNYALVQEWSMELASDEPQIAGTFAEHLVFSDAAVKLRRSDTQPTTFDVLRRMAGA